jgi:hypothetical protein
MSVHHEPEAVPPVGGGSMPGGAVAPGAAVRGAHGTAGTLADRVVAAYGGAARWRAAGAVEATVSCGGLLFRWKRGAGFRRLGVRAETGAPRARLQPIDRQGSAGVLDGHDVRIEGADGRVVASRPDARRYFPYGRRLFWWDRLDMVYFLGYAMWNYLTLPALVLRDDIAWREVAEDTLEARFPPHLPAHCDYHRFHFDRATSLLKRYDYTAEVFGNWAKAAHLILAHERSDGVPYTAVRRVKPRLPNGKVAPLPLLIWADVHDFRVV